MNNLWLHLAWKEWHEHKWKLASLIAIPLTISLFFVLVEPSGAIDAFFCAWIGYVPLAALFMAMTVASGERSAGTMDFVRSLPIPRFQVAAVRLFMGAFVCLLPLLVTAVIGHTTVCALTLMGERFESPWLSYFTPLTFIWTGTALAAMSCLTLFLWITAFAINQPTELRAGAIGVAVISIWGSLEALADCMLDNRTEYCLQTATMIYLGSPFYPIYYHRMGVPAPADWPRTFLLVQTSIYVGLISVAIRRYGQLQATTSPARGTTLTARCGPPRSSPRSALVWLQWRETLPLCAAGLLLLTGSVGSVMLMRELAEMAGVAPARDPGYAAIAYAGIAREFSMGIGFLWAIMVGTGTFAPDLEPRLANFWRSRPIDPIKWFWLKYLTGAAAIVAFIDAPVVVWILSMVEEGHWNDAKLLAFACVPLMHLAVYSIAVLLACLVRQIVYAGILAFVGALFFLALPEIVEPLSFLSMAKAMRGMTLFAHTGRPDFVVLSILPFALLVLAMIVTTTLAARWAIKRDVSLCA